MGDSTTTDGHVRAETTVCAAARPEAGVTATRPSAEPLDLINRPPHYTYSAIEPVDAIEAWGLNFFLGNVVKYCVRAEHKGSQLSDLKKARFYLEREIARLEKK